MKTNKILGFQSGHDVSYCLLENGIPTIHEELERFTREKEPLGDGLEMAFQRLPANILSNIKYFTYGNPGSRGGICGGKEADNKMKSLINKNKGEFFIVGHHQSHAANAFFSSNFDEALIITIDGGGTDKNNPQNVTNESNETPSFDTAFTVWQGKDNKITPIDTKPNDTLNIGSSWSMYTKKVFGLSSGYPLGNQSGTVMAMACVGDKNKYWKDFYDAFMQGGGKHGKKLLKNCIKYKEIASKSEQDTFDVAAGLQYATERVLQPLITDYIKLYKPTNICFSGGVILNSVAMGKMFEWTNIKNIFIDPIPYDAGLAIGSARYIYHHILGNPRITDHPINGSPYLGVLYNETDIRKALDREGCVVQQTTDEEVLDLLDKQNIISVFQGGAESGRRALGNRSILADPRNPNMKDLINKKIKHRQWYRPFAPSILREEVDKWFTEDIDSPYMSFVLKFRDEVKEKVPAVVHLDGTGRLQTVTKDINNWYYNFIKKWKEKTGVPILLNTSFNDREPIVETPEHAVNCFMGTNIDYLYFSDFNILVSKK